MAMRFQWLNRKRRTAGISHARPSRRPIQLLCLEERNSASALYGMEGLVLFSSGSQAATTRLHRPIVDDSMGSSFLLPSIGEMAGQAEENQGKEFSHGGPHAGQGSRLKERSKPERTQAGLFDALALGRLRGDEQVGLGLVDSLFASDADWSASAEEDDGDAVTKLWNSFRGKTLTSLKVEKGGAWHSIASGIDAAGSDPLGAGAGLTLGFATSAVSLSWGAGTGPQSPPISGGGPVGNNTYLATSSGPAADFGSNLQSPDRNDQAKGADKPESGDDKPAPDTDDSSTRLEIQPDKNVTIGPIAPNPTSASTVAAFPSPAVNAVATMPQGGTGFAQSIGIAPGGSVFGTTGISGRIELPAARVSVAPASTDLASASMHVGLNRSDTAAANGRADSSGALDAQSVLFRINRGSGSAHALQVRYTLKTFDQGSARTVERTAFLAAGQNQLLVLAGEELEGTRPEVATLSVAGGPGYQTPDSIATRMTPMAQGGASDGALLEAYRMGGSQDAFDTLVKQYWPGVFRTCHRILGQWADAEDVSQFVFLALTQMQMRFPPPLARWLNRVARNASIGLLRSKKRRERREQIAAKGDLTDSEESAFMAAEVIETALERLPDPLREAVSLRYLDGWSQQEAAQIVGCPRGTISQRAAHGITRLRTLITRDSA